MRLSTKLLLTICVPPALIALVGVYVVKTSEDQLRGRGPVRPGGDRSSAQGTDQHLGGFCGGGESSCRAGQVE